MEACDWIVAVFERGSNGLTELLAVCKGSESMCDHILRKVLPVQTRSNIRQFRYACWGGGQIK